MSQQAQYLCAICYDLLYEPVHTTCKHTFCLWCITKWKDRKDACPLCKAPVEENYKVDEQLHNLIQKQFPQEFMNRKNEIEEERQKAKQRKEMYEEARLLCPYNAQMVYILRCQEHLRDERIETAMLKIPRSSCIPNVSPEEACNGASITMSEIGEVAFPPKLCAIVLECLKLQEGHSFLDIGCGSGHLLALAAFLVGKDGQVHGLDINSKAVLLTQNNILKFSNKLECKKITISLGNIFDTLNISYDRICCGAGCPSGYELELCSILKPGGVMVIPVAGNLLRVQKTNDGKFEFKKIARVHMENLRLPEEIDVSGKSVLQDYDKKGYWFCCKNCGTKLFKPGEVVLQDEDDAKPKPWMADGETYQLKNDSATNFNCRDPFSSSILTGKNLFCSKCNLYLGIQFNNDDTDRESITQALKGYSYVCKSYVKLFKEDGTPLRQSTKILCSQRDCGNVITDYDQLLSHEHCWSVDDDIGTESACYYNALHTGKFYTKNDRTQQLVQGKMVVADVYCSKCNTVIGWKFVSTKDHTLINECGRFGLVDSRVKPSWDM